MTLYQLKEEYAQLLALAEEPETDAATLMDTLEGLHGEIEDKAEGYVCVIKELEAEIDKFKAESDRLATYCLTLSNRVRAMKLSLLDAMEDKTRQMSEKVNGYFENMQHEMQHEKEKPQ